jgi:YVTN family beta-propeller protein
MQRQLRFLSLGILCGGVLIAATTLWSQVPPNEFRKPRPGVKEVQTPFATVKASATFTIGGEADWIAVAGSSVWVASAAPNTLQRIDPTTNKIVARIDMPGEPCAGLVAAFDSVWVPLCAKPPSLARVDTHNNQLVALIDIGPAAAEGTITASTDSVWLVTDNQSTLSRINPNTNKVQQKIPVSRGSYNARFSVDAIWVTSVEASVVTVVDALTGTVRKTIPVGPNPRFLTAGGGSIWTLNQGDGSITRIDAQTEKVVATIQAGLPGKGGDICFCDGSVWTTIFTIPLGRIDAKSDHVTKQWTGPGGDSLGCGADSIWLTDYNHGLLQRIPFNQLEP